MQALSNQEAPNCLVEISLAHLAARGGLISVMSKRDGRVAIGGPLLWSIFEGRKHAEDRSPAHELTVCKSQVQPLGGPPTRKIGNFILKQRRLWVIGPNNRAHCMILLRRMLYLFSLQ